MERQSLTEQWLIIQGKTPLDHIHANILHLLFVPFLIFFASYCVVPEKQWVVNLTMLAYIVLMVLRLVWLVWRRNKRKQLARNTDRQQS